jgi:hypothetical protein
VAKFTGVISIVQTIDDKFKLVKACQYLSKAVITFKTPLKPVKTYLLTGLSTTESADYRFKLVITCLNLSKPVKTCQNLSKPAETCQNLSKPVKTCLIFSLTVLSSIESANDWSAAAGRCRDAELISDTVAHSIA